MPIYEYSCRGCAHAFTALRPMSEHRADTACPRCGGSAGRVLSAPRLSTMDAGARKAHQVNERSAHEPRVSQRHQCGAACNHASTVAASAPLKGQNGVKRPWMLGH
jgi:putative FmdB family regulatory protein